MWLRDSGRGLILYSLQMMLSENQDNIISDNTANKGEVFNVSGCGHGCYIVMGVVTNL